jgi:hypothetical protein
MLTVGLVEIDEQSGDPPRQCRGTCSPGVSRRFMPSKIGSWTRRVNNGRFVGRGGVKNEEPTFRVAVEVDNFQLPDQPGVRGQDWKIVSQAGRKPGLLTIQSEGGSELHK